MQGSWPEYGKYGFTADTTSDAALSWDDVKRQIYCRRTPFTFSWHWTGGGGHMMVATGYTTVRGTNYVAINNPWAPNVGDASIITYNVYVSGADHTHWIDYYNIQKQSGRRKKFLGAMLLSVRLLTHAQSVSTDSDAAAGARQSLSALGELVTEQNAQQLGFESPRQAASATLGQPFPAYLVRLDELRAWHPGASADALLKPLDRLIYPVLVDGKVRSSVTVEKGPKC